jgi:hypothetical protein
MVVKIMKLFPMVERSYKDKNTGEEKKIKSKEIIVSDGYHSMLVEATDDVAEKVEKAALTEGTMCMVTVRHLVRSWKKESGEEVFANKCLLLAIQ